MHATVVIETNIRPHCQSIHKKRFDVLQVGIEAALAGKCVTVTGLGRRSPREVTEKASIKQMDLLAVKGSEPFSGAKIRTPIVQGRFRRVTASRLPITPMICRTRVASCSVSPVAVPFTWLPPATRRAGRAM